MINIINISHLILFIIMLFFTSSCQKESNNYKSNKNIPYSEKLYDHHPFEVKSSSNPNIDDLIKGKIAYKIIDTMVVGNSYQSFVSITKAINDSILLMNLSPTDYLFKTKFRIENIKVSSKMKVLLLDPSTDNNFQIKSLSTEEQLVDSKSNTIWRWNITPLKSGSNELILRATVVIISETSQIPKDITVFEKTIIVQSSYFYSIKQFIVDSWQWLFGTLAIPFVIWLFKMRKK